MFRYTFHFENATQGWSETFYRAGAFVDGDRIFLNQYVNRRLELLAGSVYLTSIRGSNTDTKRDIVIETLPTTGRQGSWAYGGSGTSQDPGTKTYTEDTFTALLLRLTDGAQNYRSFPMLGFPDHIFEGNAIFPGEEALVRGRLNNWISAISQAGFGMKLQGVPSGSGRIVEFAAKTEENKLVCLGITGGPPTVGSIVTLGSVKPWNKLNRQWRVSQVIPAVGATPAYIYLAGTKGLDVSGAVEGGTWKAPTYGLAVMNAYTISRLTSRKTGVPFGTVRGRR